MRSLTFAYRDDDRTSVICAIRAMAARYYDLDVCVVKIKDAGDYEAAVSTARRKRSPTPRDRDHRIPRRKKIEPSHALGSSLVKGLDDAGLSTIWEAAVLLAKSDNCRISGRK